MATRKTKKSAGPVKTGKPVKAKTRKTKKTAVTKPDKKKRTSKATPRVRAPKVRSGSKSEPAPKKTAPKSVQVKKRTPARKQQPVRERRSSIVEPTISREETLRRQLIRRREDIVREAKNEIAKYVSGEANQLAETALDDGDWSVIDLSEDINLKRLETHRQSLLSIDEALRKLREGTYGVCEDCSEEISAERLRVMPFAILCRDCQEKREELEKVTREEII